MCHSVWLLLLILTPLLALAQSNQSPYAGQQAREIKALSSDEVQAYLSGQGMGLAKAAELNRYPGPLHVLELAEQLGLSEAQRKQTRKLREEVRREASRLGKLIVEREAVLDRLFASSAINANRLRTAVAEIARLQGELRLVHLRAHLEMKRLLSPAQIRKYSELRGYETNDQTHKGGGHRHGED